MIRPQECFKEIPAEPSTKSLTWTVNDDLPYLNGHFPQSPILPAIAIVDASTYILQKVLQRPELVLKSVIAAKFMSPIVPQTKLQISWSEGKAGEWNFEWKEASSARLLVSLSVLI